MSDAQDEYAQHLDKCSKLLPAWFVGRMTFDNWHFGLALTTGQVLYVEHLSDVRQAVDGSLWLEVVLYGQADADTHLWKFGKLIGAPTSRKHASVNAAHVVFVVELADT
jgi:hypothetical protein